jgi:hypothetical protein
MSGLRCRRDSKLVAGGLAVVFASSLLAATFTGVHPASAAALSIRVAGSQLINGSGRPVQLRGVNRSGTEYACIQGWGIFDGASDQASIAAIASWHTNAVRIPMNEDCWLDINGVNPAYGGTNYQQAIINYVNLLNSYGIYAILDLASVAPGTTQAGLGPLQPMPDQDHSPDFWSSVAATFKNNPAVLFDVFNEPFPDNNSDTTAAWTCWRDGGTCPGVPYPAAGMQELVDTVRAAGATNVITLPGIGFASVFDQWGVYEPTDTDGQLVADFHNYVFGGCTTADCWSTIPGDLNGAPLLTGEMGFDGYIETYMAWADAHGIGYLAWTWDTWGCGGVQALISDYSGTPCSPYGTGYQQHLAALASTPAQLVFTVEPGGGTSGSAWLTQPVVTIENVDGNPVSADTATVTLTIQTNAGGGALSGCSATTAAGAASFSGCQIDKAGTGYELTATDTTDSLTATSGKFNVVGGAPAQLVFTSQPGGGTTRTAWPLQPTVTIEDADANVVTSDTNTITLTITSGTGKRNATLTGCSATTTAGVAPFSGCQIDKAGSGYELSATDTGDSLRATSSSFDITHR